MRIFELIQLTEAISLTKFEPDFQQAIKQAMIKSVQELYNFSTTQPDYTSLVDKSQEEFSKKIRELVQTDITRVFNRSFRIALIKQGEIALPDAKDILSVRFTDIPDLGNALGYRIELNINYIDTVSKEFANQLLDTFYDQFGEQDLMTSFQRYLKRFDSRELEHIFYNYKIDKQVTSMVDTMLHELAHIYQQNAEKKKGRTGHDYRSYLAPGVKGTEKFYKSFEKRGPEFTRLHVSSPQEIGAYVQNIVVNLVRTLGWDVATDPNELTIYSHGKKIDPEYTVDWNNSLANEIKSAVIEHLKPRLGNIDSKRRQKVYQRYLKFVYQELMNYRDNKLSQLETS